MTAAQHHDSFTIERTYEKCRDHVWSAWASQEKKNRWMGGGITRMEFAPGGVETLISRDAMGEHVNETRYFEIADKTRIVMAYSMALNGRVHSVSLATVTFADEGGGTRLTFTEQICVIPPSDGAPGRKHGWTALLDRVDDVLSADVVESA
jgi:uncharacterized protein YndB with AHSA1/START domain